MARRPIWVLVLAAVCAVVLACNRPATTRAPEPPAASPVAVEAKLANKFVQSGGSRSLTARIGLSAKRRSATARPPVNLGLLVDTSGSMEGRAIEDARAASLA